MKCATLAPTHEFIMVSTMGPGSGDIFINPAWSTPRKEHFSPNGRPDGSRGAPPAPQPGPSPALREGKEPRVTLLMEMKCEGN